MLILRNPALAATEPALPSVSAATLTVQARFGDDRLTTTWPREVSIPPQIRLTEDNPDHDFGLWEPARTAYSETGGNVTQTTHWQRAEDETELFATLTSPAFLALQVARLTEFDLVRETGNSPTYWGFDPAKTNDLARWNALLAPLPDHVGGLIYYWNIAPANRSYDANLRAILDDGTWLLEIIEEDLLEATNLSEALAVLETYQIALNRGGGLSFTGSGPTDSTGDLALVFIDGSFSYEQDARDPALLPIQCSYIIPGGENGELTLPATGAVGRPLFVEEPANTEPEARLEIALQRARLAANHTRGTARVVFSPALTPLQVFTHHGDARRWQILSVEHRWPSPETTLRFRLL